MSRDGVGTFTLTAGLNPVVTGTSITSNWWNTTGLDIAAAVTASIANDGQTPILANLPMATFRHTGVGNAVARTDYASAGQIQDNSLVWGGTAGGTADALTLTLAPIITAYVTGQRFLFISSASANTTTTPTLVVSGLAAKTFKRKDGTAIVAGDIPASTVCECVYNGTNMVLMTNGGANTVTSLSNITATIAANSINNGDFAQTWNWALTTAAKSAIKITENTAATGGAGAQYLLDVQTITASTAIPFRVRSLGLTDTILVSRTGDVTITGVGSATTPGVITITGGAPTTAATAGAAVNIVGGLGNTSGNGGAIVITSGAAGSTSASGAVTISSGTTTAGASGAVTIGSGNATGGVPGTTTINAGAAQTAATAGGAIAITAGAGNTSGAGGAVTITSGAAGNTGVAGVINITVGNATAGNGSAMTLTAGNGAGGTASGGHLNLVPGAAVSTGLPGEIQANGDSGWIIFNDIQNGQTAGSHAATKVVGVCQRAMRLKAVSRAFTTASSSGTLQVEKLTGTTAPGSGTNLLTGTVALTGAANTVVSGTLIATVASLTFAAGDRVGFVFGGTVTGLIGSAISASFAPV